MSTNGSNALLVADPRAATPRTAVEARSEPAHPSVAVVGLGYVGLPTALAFHAVGRRVVGIEVDRRRRRCIATGTVDLERRDRARLHEAIGDPSFRVMSGGAALAGADAVVICVPTPVDRYQVPDASILREACAQVAAAARPGQLIVLTSTSYVGTTRQMLMEPLAARGLRPGLDVLVAFCPERIDPGRCDHDHQETPRVVGGCSPASSEAAARLLGPICGGVHVVSSPEVAEMSKLVENTFRAVNIALANEYADVAGGLGLDVTEVIDAAATKPYGFMAFRPGPGVGGHCIPCDPHYLLWQLRAERLAAPLIEGAMAAIATRPQRVAERCLAALGRLGIPPAEAHVALVGLSYKAGVRDVRHAPSGTVAAVLRRAGVEVTGWDPYLDDAVVDDDGAPIPNQEPGPGIDLGVVLTVHPDLDHRWLDGLPAVVDATYRLGRTGPPLARSDA